MTVKLTKQELDDISEFASDVEDKAKSARKAIADTTTPGLTGFQTKSAIEEVHSHWDSKASKCANRWLYFSGAVAATADHVDATDKANAFYLPTGIPGERN